MTTACLWPSAWWLVQAYKYPSESQTFDSILLIIQRQIRYFFWKSMNGFLPWYHFMIVKYISPWCRYLYSSYYPCVAYTGLWFHLRHDVTKYVVRNDAVKLGHQSIYKIKWLQVLGLNSTLQRDNRIEYSLNTKQLFVSHQANHYLLTP